MLAPMKLLLLCARGVEAEGEWKKIKSEYERLIGIDCYYYRNFILDIGAKIWMMRLFMNMNQVNTATVSC